ncbi:MAG: IPTL-CTERM sorting domain-containing protein [Acidobacteriota bacterium]
MQLLSTRRRPSAFRTLTGLWLVSFLSFGPTLAAAIRTVDDNGPAAYSSITAALAASSAGDTVQVAAGTYDQSRETFPLALKDGVAIVGAGRDTTTILTPDGVPAFVNDATPLGPTTRLQGFTLTQGAGDTGQNLMQFFLGDATMTPQIAANRFAGNMDELDGAIIIAAQNAGGVFDGTISGNEFRGFGGSLFSGSAMSTAEVSVSFPGGVAMGKIPETSADAASRAHRPQTNVIVPAEDRVTPTIRGNVFEANLFGIAAIGSNPGDCSCDTSGIMAPLIDDNEFVENAFDNLLLYSGFGVREFSPTVSNNTSTFSFISVGSLPYFYGGPLSPSPSRIRSQSIKGKPAQSAQRMELFRQMLKNLEQGKIGQSRPRDLAARNVRPQGVPAPEPSSLYDVTISGNTITDSIFAGVLIYQDLSNDGSITVNADIQDNAVVSTQDALGGIVFGTAIDDLTTQLPGSLQFNGNNVSGPSDSLVVVLGNVSGGAVAPSSVKLAAAAATDVQIVGNQLQNGSTGLQFLSDGYTTVPALVSCNVITDQSTAGVEISDGADPTPDFGGGARTSPGLNSLHDNALNVTSAELDEVKAENNYWGTSNPTAVDASIDGNVDFTPFLTTQPVGCNLIAATDADLALVKTVTSTGPYQVGSTISYTLTVTNNGPATATNVEITDPIPFGTEFVSASSDCTASPVTVTCTRPSLANGASRVFNITLRATEEGSVQNIAVADSDQLDPVAGNSVATAAPVTVTAPAAESIPTTSEWGLMLMGAMLACAGLWFSRRS